MRPRPFVLALTPSPLLLLLLCALATADFKDHFKDCHPNTLDFDICMLEGMNAIRSYFKTGLPQYNVLPFDPFFAKEISVKRGIQNFGFTLTLRNVTEHGWSLSKMTKFNSDIKNYKIVYTQSFPEKFLSGSYEFKGVFFNTSVVTKGTYTMTLYDLIQMTTVTKLPGQKIRAQIDVQSIKDMKLHIKNILAGKKFLENIIHRIINDAWEPGFVITRGLINELVSTAFTEIFDTNFRNFPFEKIFIPSTSSTASVTSSTAMRRYRSGVENELHNEAGNTQKKANAGLSLDWNFVPFHADDVAHRKT